MVADSDNTVLGNGDKKNLRSYSSYEMLLRAGLLGIYSVQVTYIYPWCSGGRVVSQTCSCFSTLCCGKAKVDLDVLGEGLDVSFFSVSLSMGSIVLCVVRRTHACVIREYLHVDTSYQDSMG